MNRRQFFHGRTQQVTRPPWTKTETGFIEACTRCHDCISACPEHIIVRGSGGYPEIDFHQGECTFCQQCADACQADAFTDNRARPWHLAASLGGNCLVSQGMSCFTCSENCEAEAISVAPVLRQGSLPVINTDNCSGCGACVRPCPVAAISILPVNTRIPPAMEVYA